MGVFPEFRISGSAVPRSPSFALRLRHWPRQRIGVSARLRRGSHTQVSESAKQRADPFRDVSLPGGRETALLPIRLAGLHEQNFSAAAFISLVGTISWAEFGRGAPWGASGLRMDPGFPLCGGASKPVPKKNKERQADCMNGGHELNRIT